MGTSAPLSFSCAGTECKAWSTVGGRSGFGHKSEYPHAVWREARVCQGGRLRQYEDVWFSGRPTHWVCVLERLCLHLPELCLPVFVFADRQTLGFFQMPFCGCLGRNPCLPGRQTLVVCRKRPGGNRVQTNRVFPFSPPPAGFS